MGLGSAMMPYSIFSAGARMGDHCILNNMALAGHDSHIGNGANICDGAIVGAFCNIGEQAFLGLKAVVLPHQNVGERAIIGAGAVVIEDIPPDMTAVGVPARVVKSLAA